jgi:hypothetical protein
MLTKIENAVINLLEWAGIAFITLAAVLFTLGGLTVGFFALINGFEFMDLLGMAGCFAADWFCWNIWR